MKKTVIALLATAATVIPVSAYSTTISTKSTTVCDSYLSCETKLQHRSALPKQKVNFPTSYAFSKKSINTHNNVNTCEISAYPTGHGYKIQTTLCTEDDYNSIENVEIVHD